MKEIFLKYIWQISILIGILTGYGIGYPSVFIFKEYGWTVFTVVPFFLGMIPPLIYGSRIEITRREAIKIGFATLGLFCLSTLLFAIEGIICIIMASPLIALCTWLGSLLGFYFVKKKETVSKQLYSFILLPIIFLTIDIALKTTEFLEVKTEIYINAPIETVWCNIISFGKIDEPKEFLFKTGIAYPTHAEIKGSGIGAVRYCNFTTGSFVEPITNWDEPTLLQFDVLEQPTAMRELNPFWDVHPPHLDGYFQSKKGQFKLTELGKGKTRVEGTTWYNIHIHPVQYWDFWSKYILHQIHYRGLKHIKKESEK
ncbi:MAG: hypothetical protein IPN72_09015 [Saprospiraceae bacterium]|nr:hypothetical protein [Saprospiraceae bacterium]